MKAGCNMSETPALHMRLPLTEADAVALHCGDAALLSGVLLTGRDAAHKWLNDTFIEKTTASTEEDRLIYGHICEYLKNGAVYHCGPVVKREGDVYRFMAAGPTTSIREEVYQADVMRHFSLRAVIGKGGMGTKTLQACRELGAVYCSITGGAAALAADCVKEVLGVYKLEFGVPEALWVIRVENLPVVVSMDAHGCSLHEQIRAASRQVLDRLMDSSI